MANTKDKQGIFGNATAKEVEAGLNRSQCFQPNGCDYCPFSESCDFSKIKTRK